MLSRELPLPVTANVPDDIVSMSFREWAGTLGLLTASPHLLVTKNARTQLWCGKIPDLAKLWLAHANTAIHTHRNDGVERTKALED
jgi:hypothetical protein